MKKKHNTSVRDSRLKWNADEDELQAIQAMDSLEFEEQLNKGDTEQERHKKEKQNYASFR